MLLADKANQYIDKMQPWALLKDKKNRKLVHSICTTNINLFRILAIMLSPVVPNLITRINDFLQIDFQSWIDIDKDLVNHKIKKFEPLLTRIEKEKIDQIKEKSRDS